MEFMNSKKIAQMQFLSFRMCQKKKKSWTLLIRALKGIISDQQFGGHVYFRKSFKSWFSFSCLDPEFRTTIDSHCPKSERNLLRPWKSDYFFQTVSKSQNSPFSLIHLRSTVSSKNPIFELVVFLAIAEYQIFTF